MVHVAAQLPQDPALDRLAPLIGQQPLGVRTEGGRLVAAREQGPEAIQPSLQPCLDRSRSSQINCGAGDGTAAMAAFRGLNQTPATYHMTSRCRDSYQHSSIAKFEHQQPVYKLMMLCYPACTESLLEVTK